MFIFIEKDLKFTFMLTIFVSNIIYMNFSNYQLTMTIQKNLIIPDIDVGEQHLFKKRYFGMEYAISLILFAIE